MFFYLLRGKSFLYIVVINRPMEFRYIEIYIEIAVDLADINIDIDISIATSYYYDYLTRKKTTK